MQRRLNITIDEHLDDELIAFCKKNSTNKSGIIAIAVSQYLEAQKNLPTLVSQLDDLKDKIDKLLVKTK